MIVLLPLVLPVVPEVQVVSKELKEVLEQWVNLESSLPCQSRLASNLSRGYLESLRCRLCRLCLCHPSCSLKALRDGQKNK